jgi:hypothetical protein
MNFSSRFLYQAYRDIEHLSSLGYSPCLWKSCLNNKVLSCGASGVDQGEGRRLEEASARCERERAHIGDAWRWREGEEDPTGVIQGRKQVDFEGVTCDIVNDVAILDYRDGNSGT